jgi:pyochelin biosynthetic protein PchC
MRRLRPSPGRPRLICFPHAGGAASFFDPFAKALEGVLDVVALQYPARQERLPERCIDSIDDLRDAIVAELDGWLDGPFALFGHSTGAIVAYEVARVLGQQHDLVPAGLFTSGRRAPTTQRDEHVHRGGDARLLQEVARLGGTPPQLLEEEDVRQMMLPALRGDYKAIETYQWQPAPGELSCPIWALVGDADPLTTAEEAAAWSAHTSGDFELRTFPGGHFYLAAHQAELVELVSEVLAS